MDTGALKVNQVRNQLYRTVQDGTAVQDGEKKRTANRLCVTNVTRL